MGRGKFALLMASLWIQDQLLTKPASKYSENLRKEAAAAGFTKDAIDPETGKPLLCSGSVKRTPINTFKGKSAKEIGIKLTEIPDEQIISSTDHALYLGRELQKAEDCLKHKKTYIQD